MGEGEFRVKSAKAAGQRIVTVMMKSRSRKTICLFFVALLLNSILHGATIHHAAFWTLRPATAQETGSEEEQNAPKAPQEDSSQTRSESSPEKPSPLKDFVPSEKIEADKAVDFPVDI